MPRQTALSGIFPRAMTPLWENGALVSPVVRSRECPLARALLRNAPVLVLDDSTTALDVSTEKRLLADIKKHYPDRTLLISPTECPPW